MHVCENNHKIYFHKKKSQNFYLKNYSGNGIEILTGENRSCFVWYFPNIEIKGKQRRMIQIHVGNHSDHWRREQRASVIINEAAACDGGRYVYLMQANLIYVEQ